jgi:dethiobiotin synthetase
MMRPRSLLIVAGTGTEVGKTWAARQVLLQARQRGLRVAARKPAQSYLEGEGPTDAEQLGAVSGEAPQQVCVPHRWYPLPMAPPMAADALGRPPLWLDELVSELVWPANIDLGLVETAGGLYSPITHDADNARLIERLAPDAVLLVADAGLGTLNAVRSSLPALGSRDVGVLLNRFDATQDLHRRNRDWLLREGVRVMTDVETWWQIRD